MLDSRCRHGSVVWLLACLLASWPGWADGPTNQGPAAEHPGFEMERVSWLGRVENGGAVAVANSFGDVRVRFGGYEGVVEVVATLQHFADEGPPLVLAANAAKDGVEIVVGFRRQAGGEWMTRRLPDEKKRADIVVFVPAGASLRAATDDGLLEIRKIKSDVQATTHPGPKRSTAGAGLATR